MKHLLVLLSLMFSVCAFSQPTDYSVPDNPAVVLYVVPEAAPDYSAKLGHLRFAQEFREADSEFNRTFNYQKVIVVYYVNDFGQVIETLNSGKKIKRRRLDENTSIRKQASVATDKLITKRCHTPSYKY